MLNKKILVVEDDGAIQNILRIALSKEGYEVTQAFSAEEVGSAAASRSFDLVILDLGLPKKDGYFVIETLRKEGRTFPILVLSARNGEDDKVRALDSGANDYVEKPFLTGELLARVRAATRVFISRQKDEPFQNGELTIDFSARSVFVSGQEIRLTGIEFRLLSLLAQNIGRTLTHSFIITSLWGPGGSDSGSLRVHMASLRRKLEPSPLSERLIRTDVGVGYRMNVLNE